MTLRLYDTLTKQKQTLEDLPGFDRNNVRMYVCGPTVYDYAHIGNARPVIVFDVLFRLLRHLYGAEHVTYVRNITDIDDKINARAAEVAAEKHVSVEAARAEITALTAKQYEDDVAALGCLPPTHSPRATEYVPRMVSMIERLLDPDDRHAYVEQGHVLFDVSSKSDYGKLSRRPLDEMLAGARVEVAPYKKNPMDFVLWKPSDAQTPGWDSPWGRGRPGWHIECSAMGEALLGETFDIHGGGIDLMFPHHENEIAQSESAHHGDPLARLWMHNGFLQVESEKMSKSLGNFVTIRELLSSQKFGAHQWPGNVLRVAMLMTHYRQPIDWTLDRLQESAMKIAGWLGPASSREVPERGAVSGSVISAISDDLDAHAGFMALDELSSLQHSKDGEVAKKAANDLAASLLWFGIARSDDFDEARADSDERRETIRAAVAGLDLAMIRGAIDARNAARKAKDFKESDRIRDELLAKGIVLKDNADGTTTWEVKR